MNMTTEAAVLTCLCSVYKSHNPFMSTNGITDSNVRNLRAILKMKSSRNKSAFFYIIWYYWNFFSLYISRKLAQTLDSSQSYLPTALLAKIFYMLVDCWTTGTNKQWRTTENLNTNKTSKEQNLQKESFGDMVVIRSRQMGQHSDRHP